MKQILFVDDDVEIQRSMRRVLRKKTGEWQMAFAASAVEALNFLQHNPVDVIVTDYSMPGMKGGELLRIVQQAFPSVVRIVFTGLSDSSIGLNAAKSAHIFIKKPSDPETIINTITRQLSLDSFLDNKKLQEVITRLTVLPSLPSHYLALMDELKREDPSAERVGRIISNDPAMAAKILQLVNSAFFGLPQQVSSPAQATVLLGLDTMRALVLSMEIFSKFKTRNLSRLGLAQLWDHSLAVGNMSRAICNRYFRGDIEFGHAFVAGVLHDVGKLVLANNFPEEYMRVVWLAKQREIEVYEAEFEVFGACHGQIGAFLLGRWGLPSTVIQAAFFHNYIEAIPSSKVHLVHIISIANSFDHEDRRVRNSPFKRPEIKVDQIPLDDIEEKIPEYRQICDGLRVS